MKDKEVMKKLGAEIDKEFEKIKRKALKIAPFFASALPGGATLATALYAYNQNLMANEYARQAVMHEADAEALESFANSALDYVRAVAIGDEKEIERTGVYFNQLFSKDNLDNVSLLERYCGEEGKDFIINLVGNVDKKALDEIADKFGFESGTDLAYKMSDNPQLVEKVRADYMGSLYNHVEDARINLWEAEPIQEHKAQANEAWDNYIDATDNVAMGSGLGVLLSTVTMAVTMGVVHHHKKYVEKLEAEEKAREQAEGKQASKIEEQDFSM